MALLQLKTREAVLTINEVAYDQAGLPTILGWHRATTASHAYVNGVR
jgi:GntR family transcriptional regulator